ncbi:unnamed protein product [Moneuplotes crassus]|uniref:Uncharacterized protein n=1 Tax=Euplotes crassus TaxID=5936 RepID=A0AAD2CX99_EUPCR|nr:unnamed protein product [Moneuplotes crassus]
MIILLLWLFFCIALGCEDGFYDSGGGCLPCESSCKTCSQDGECTECDDYMFMDDMTGMCDHCPDGEFYDFSRTQCNNCDNSCSGYCEYQESCFTCSPTEVLNLETMTCVPSCPVGTIQISDPVQYKLSSFCRSMDYYVDPTSEEIMELGTKAYPYRTISPVFAEILKQHSHKDRKVSIFIKEGANVFIQDSTAFFINVTQVSVSTYNQNSISQGMATITTTDAIVEGLSKKAAFHLMKDLTLDIGSVVSAGNFSDAEVGSIGRGGDTFQCVRTSLEMSKIVARRIAKTTTSGVLIYLLYLQRKEIKISKLTRSY